MALSSKKTSSRLLSLLGGGYDDAPVTPAAKVKVLAVNQQDIIDRLEFLEEKVKRITFSAFSNGKSVTKTKKKYFPYKYYKKAK